MAFNAILENKILVENSEFTVESADWGLNSLHAG